MITFKPIIIPGGKRKDNTWPVKIRVTFKGKSRRLPTTLSCRDADLTRSGKIKNATILERADELIREMRASCSELTMFTLERWDIDKVVKHIKKSLAVQDDFRLDFFEFAEKYIATKNRPSTQDSYKVAIRAFKRYYKKDELDINDITRSMLLDFIEYCNEEKLPGAKRKVYGRESLVHIKLLSAIYNSAKWKYNDEDSGIIVIPRSPFAKLNKMMPKSQGQEPLTVEVMQKMIDTKPENKRAQVFRAAFLLSFCTMGANMADLWKEQHTPEELWDYNRKKTGVKAKVLLTKEAKHFAEQLCDKGKYPDWWLGKLHYYATDEGCSFSLNNWLKKWAEREKVKCFTFYAARHTWATLARREGIEKATVDDALAHVGDYRMADVYAEKNWQLAWDANRKILDLFTWS